MIEDLFASETTCFGTKQYASQPTACGRGFEIKIPYGSLIYIPKFIEKKIADRTLAVFFENDHYDWENTNWHDVDNINELKWTNIAWQQDTVKLYGKKHELPRVSAWYGDTGKSYKYSWQRMMNWKLLPLIYFRINFRAFRMSMLK